ERNVGKSNIGDSDNTEDGGKIVSEAIKACGGIAYKEGMEVLVRCWSDGDVVPTSVLLASVVGFVLSFRWFHGLFMVQLVGHLQLWPSKQEDSTSDDGDSDNTGDGGKIVDGAIRVCGGIGERASETKRSLVKSSKNVEECFLVRHGEIVFREARSSQESV
ncbi:hypothetical protein Tco_1302285, partial [Tanacetum coccineum]